MVHPDWHTMPPALCGGFNLVLAGIGRTQDSHCDILIGIWIFSKKSRKLARIADASVNIILILWFGGHFVFWWHFVFQNFVHTNFHAKSGLCSSRNERVMLNFVIWRPFVFQNFVKKWVSYAQFCDLAAILFFKFLSKFVQIVHTNLGTSY